ncbi:MAG: 50S ribosomal protein L9 [Elusimicrobia bacterium RIFOXYA2_FULL_39_19]|nr:MAG: 50S ribosomal protein L9 [Elusimicrobia bacterium RIFOXYA2_FULL_39_19]
MKIILKQDIKGLGNAGEVMDVKAGYARNLLFPKNLALIANDHSLAIIKHEKEIIEKLKGKEKIALKETIDKLSKVSVNISVKTGEGGKLFGSVTKDDIAEAIKKESGIDVDKHEVHLENPIKETGLYSVEVKVRSKKYSDEISETAKVKVWVVEVK